MSTNKERILRDIEYVTGGISAYKTLCDSKKEYASHYKLLDEWEDILFGIIDMIEEDYGDGTPKS